MKPTEMPIALIRTDAGTQTRSGINNEWVTEIAEAMESGAELPPVVVFSDGSECFMGDGFHRVLAACRIGRESIMALVHKGTREDALIHSLGANAAHGLKRTNPDKRNCVTIAVREFPQWTHEKVAEVCGVSIFLVHQIRGQLLENKSSPQPATRVGKDGKARPTSYKKTTRPVPAPEPLPEPESEPEEKAVVHSADEEIHDPSDPDFKAPNPAEFSDADKETDALFHLKSYWRKATKKDRRAFLQWATV